VISCFGWNLDLERLLRDLNNFISKSISMKLDKSEVFSEVDCGCTRIVICWEAKYVWYFLQRQVVITGSVGLTKK
jgi:hypothetical protein